MFTDLDITIIAEESPALGANVTVRYGSATETSTFSRAAVAEPLAHLDAALATTQPPLATLQAAGAALFDALFQGRLLRTYTIATAPGRKVRLRLNTNLPSLVAIPWEYLYDQERWLAMSPDFSLVRTLSLPASEPQPVTGALRVLVMISDPADLPQLDTIREWANLQAVADEAAIELIRIEPTYEALLGALRQQPHSFHFIGHGKFDAASQQGFLAFRSADDRADFVPAEQLVTALAGCKTLRLALLNACQGATVGARSAFAGVAQKLIQQGLPAVIAMQAAITDEDALHFSQEFYRALADGYTLEAAVGEGRKRIAERSTAWGVPALYCQGSEPFAIPQLDDTQKAARLWARVEPIANQPEQPERVLRLVTQILQLQPRHVGAQKLQAQWTNAAEAARLYTVADTYLRNQQWPEAYRTLEHVRRLHPNYRDSWQRLTDLKRRLDETATTLAPDYLAQVQEYQPLLNALKEGRLVPFLGWDVSRLGRPAAMDRVPGESSPRAEEIAAQLVEPLHPQVTSATPLLQVSQYTVLLEGHAALYRRLRELYTQSAPPTILHQLLAELPGRLRAKGFLRETGQRFIIFTVALDDLLERAFDAVGQPYHLFAYRHRFVEDGVDHSARFVHIPPGGAPSEVIDPLPFDAHERDNHPILIKLCGLRPTEEPGSVVVTEDQFLDYLPAQEIGDLLPTRLLRQINRRNFAFFGYSLQPWHLRLIWQRMKVQKRRLHEKSWAIVPTLSAIEREFWVSHEITPLVAAPEGVVTYIDAWLKTL